VIRNFKKREKKTNKKREANNNIYN